MNMEIRKMEEPNEMTLQTIFEDLKGRKNVSNEWCGNWRWPDAYTRQASSTPNRVLYAHIGSFLKGTHMPCRSAVGLFVLCIYIYSIYRGGGSRTMALESPLTDISWTTWDSQILAYGRRGIRTEDEHRQDQDNWCLEAGRVRSIWRWATNNLRKSLSLSIWGVTLLGQRVWKGD